jgi:hypothetical protein
MIQENIEEEKQLATEAGDIEEETGMPFISVYGDGGN